MYNDELKNTYITEKTKTATVDKFYLPNLFKRCEPFETELNKDVCNFTTKEIENMYKTLDYKGFETIVVTNSALSLYTNWCLSQGVSKDSQNHFLEFDRPRLSMLINKAYKNARVVSRETISDWCRQLPNPSDAFVLMGLFEGISGKDYTEFTHLMIDDVDIERSTILLPGRKEPVVFSKELCRYAIESANEKWYYSISEEMKRKVEFKESRNVIKEYCNSDSSQSDYQKGRRIYSKLIRILNFLGVKNQINASAIVNSGIVDLIKRESKRMKISPTEYINNYLSEISYRYPKKMFTRSVMIYKFGDILGE